MLFAAVTGAYLSDPWPFLRRGYDLTTVYPVIFHGVP